MATYTVPSGDRIWAGRDVVMPDPDDVSFTWPPGPNCVIPNAEGVNAPIHPKVLDFGVAWNGYRYWMAFTPYPNAANNDLLENPCIVASNDGDTWVAPAPNPIVPAPVNATEDAIYNHDTHLVFKDGVLYLFWLWIDKSGVRHKRADYKTTADGVNWSDTQNIYEVISNTEDSYSASSCFEYFDGKWWLWEISNYATPFRLLFKTAPSLAGPWSERTLCSLSLPDNKSIWHMDIIRIPNGWALLGCDSVANFRRTWLAVSKDGLTWTVATWPLSNASPGTYRSSFVRNGAGFDCWISDFDTRRIRRLRLNLVV